MERLILCVDGGGTRSRARLVRRDGTVLAAAQGGPCNATTDAARAAASVSDLWRMAAAAAGLGGGAEAGAELAIGAAGLGLAASRERLFAALPRFAGRIVMSDGYAALVGAGEGRPAGLVVMGTGAVAHALRADGVSVQRDGWGWIGGDRGSGAWIGREAVQHALAARDGASAGSALAARIASQLGGEDAAILAWLSQAGQGPLASLTPLVAEAASAGDEAAGAILDRAAGHGAALVRCLGLGEGTPVFAVGSVADLLRSRMEALLGRAFDPPAGDAMHGAFLVATGRAPPERRA
ncbi:BadF/BadG/BcrA/BcrD ATPase family protein [Faunimonas sp. B44]|uniref:BadF/BadG/BcrA/BcrD ATPase family protein n=1 Tax=Faunimonas sp. B44 TaxID=3461493 RepID=UPI0040443C69